MSYYQKQLPPAWLSILLIALLIFVAIAATCGSVQGQTPDSILTSEDEGCVEYVCVDPSDKRLDSPYYQFVDYDASCSRGEIYGALYHRLDRWYLDTVQVCDTVNVTVSLQILLEGFDIGERYIPSIAYQVICRDTTIYAKRVKKTETKWVIPGESK